MMLSLTLLPQHVVLYDAILSVLMVLAFVGAEEVELARGKCEYDVYKAIKNVQGAEQYAYG